MQTIETAAQQPKQPVLAFDNVTFKYPVANAPYVMKDASAQFYRGVFYSIIGASGSGKTTALSLAGGLDTPTAGAVTFEGRNIRDIGYTAYRRSNVAMVFQSYNLIPYMTALENVMLTMEISGTHKDDRKQRAMQLLADVGLDGTDIGRSVTRLSGGQQQRVAVARALAGDAPVILADEPTGNLDSETAGEMITIFRRLAKEKDRCVIVVSHSGKVAKASDVVMRFKNKTLEQLVRDQAPAAAKTAGDQAAESMDH